MLTQVDQVGRGLGTVGVDHPSSNKSSIEAPWNDVEDIGSGFSHLDVQDGSNEEVDTGVDLSWDVACGEARQEPYVGQCVEQD